MTVAQIIALSQAGFSAEQIEQMAGVLDPAPAPTPDPAPAPTPDPAPAPTPDHAPKWFTDFMTKYNQDYADLNRRFQGRAVQIAEAGEGTAPKTAEQLMNEAFAGLR